MKLVSYSYNCVTVYHIVTNVTTGTKEVPVVVMGVIAHFKTIYLMKLFKLAIRMSNQIFKILYVCTKPWIEGEWNVYFV